MDEKQILDTYWPVIEEVIELQAFYNGTKDRVPKIAPDSILPLMKALIKARKEMPVKRTVEEV